ncbi:hypothetical protein R9X47_15245 [Wukongibacter baidiensis]|uniref:hypothetical protein n=1 Tax=Wukongibacter baidiensis TaxID=1723361 RepID=UPI003D7F3E1A
MSIFNIPPDEFALIAALLGVGIANKLDANEQNSIGNFLESVGQTILTISAQEQLQQSLIEKEKQNEQLKLQIEIMEKQMELLKKQVED